MDSIDKLKKQIKEAVRHDNPNLFFQLTDQLPVTCYNDHFPQKVLMWAADSRALRCLSALLNGKTVLNVHVNHPTPDGMYPIFQPAFIADAGTVELLLYHGASADVCVNLLEDDDTPYPPLMAVLLQASAHVGEYRLDHTVSVYQLLTFVCLQRCLRTLECLELLSWETDGSLRDKVFFSCVKRRDFFSVALLLAVARNQLLSAVKEVKSSLCGLTSVEIVKDLSDGDKEKLVHLLHLFEVAGDPLESYIRENKMGRTVTEISNRVSSLLQVDPAATSLQSLHRGVHFQPFVNGEPLDYIAETHDDDVGMEHYGSSSHRWRRYNEPTSGYKNSKTPVLRPCKRPREPSCSR